jgi:hypothetical protein
MPSLQGIDLELRDTSLATICNSMPAIVGLGMRASSQVGGMLPVKHVFQQHSLIWCTHAALHTSLSRCL